jgi:hypothetical protein
MNFRIHQTEERNRLNIRKIWGCHSGTVKDASPGQSNPEADCILQFHTRVFNCFIHILVARTSLKWIVWLRFRTKSHTYEQQLQIEQQVIDFFPPDVTALRESGHPHYRGFTITFRRTTFGRTPLDEWSARRRDLYLTIHSTHKS